MIVVYPNAISAYFVFIKVLSTFIQITRSTVTQMNTKPALSFWQIWNMSFGFLGIQIGFALQNANLSRIFETFGAKIGNIAILWIAVPATSLIIQLIVGRTSDKTWIRSGWLHPKYIVGVILALLTLLIMPNSSSLLIVSGLLLIWGASVNFTIEPFYAFAGKMFPGGQSPSGFAMPSFLICLGGVVASALPWIFTNWSNVSNEVVFGEGMTQSVKLSFYLSGAIFLLGVLWTVYSTKKYSLKNLPELEPEKKQSSINTEHSFISSANLLPGLIRNGFILLILGIFGSILIQQMSWEKALYVISIGLGAFGLIFLAAAWYTRQGLVHNGFVEVITELMNVPKSMKQLAIVQFFSWFALFDMWIYSTSAVTSHIYGTNDTATALYNEGANWVGVLFATYNGFALVAVLFLPLLAKWTSRKIAHTIALFWGSIGLASFYFVKDPHMLVVSMLGVRFAWASILSLPYIILDESLPIQKRRNYWGILNFFIAISQILAASILAFFIRVLFHGNAIYALILGGTSLLIAALSVLFVDDFD